MARHGENIRRRKDGRWEGRYKAFNQAKGKSAYRSVYGKCYIEAKEKLARAKSGMDSQDREGRRAQAGAGDAKGEDGGDGAILFSRAAGEWLGETCGRKKHSTYVKYSAVYRTHLDGMVGSCRLCAGAAQELREKIFDHLSGEGMSESLKKSVVCVANQILAFANARYSSGVPLLARPAAGAEKKASGIFSRAEQAMLLGCIHGRMDKFMAAVLLCLHTGLRLGELCSLRWTDIDFEGMTLTVGRTVQRIAVSGCGKKTALMETDPKSASSRRTVPLTSEILELLSRFRGEDPYVFGGEKPMEPRTMQYRFKKILKEAGIASRNFHTLRHTFATNCAENGMDVKMLCELLGHSDVKITLNLYVHPTMDAKRRQIGALSDFYGQICGQVA